MMVRLPSCNIDRPIYIWLIEIKLKDTRTLSPHLQTRPSLVHPYLQQPHCWAIKKGSLWNKLAWWPLPASSILMPPLSPTTNHHHAPLLFTLSPISRDIISFYTWDYSRMGQSQQVCYKKCILIFRVMHRHLASTTEDLVGDDGLSAIRHFWPLDLHLTTVR